MQVSANGLWDLQPAVNRMTELDRERGEEVGAASNCCLLSRSFGQCNPWMDGRAMKTLAKSAMEISHANGLIRAAGQPTIITAAEIKNMSLKP